MLTANDNNVEDKGLKALYEIVEERKKSCKSEEELLLCDAIEKLLGLVVN